MSPDSVSCACLSGSAPLRGSGYMGWERRAPAEPARTFRFDAQYVAGLGLEAVLSPPEICFSCSGVSFVGLTGFLDEVLVVFFFIAVFLHWSRKGPGGISERQS